MTRLLFLAVTIVLAVSCTADEQPFRVTPLATFDEPWAMTFLPDGRLLVTEKGGQLFVVTQAGEKSPPATGIPQVDYQNHGGLGDIVLHPDYATNRVVYISYVEAGANNTRGAAIIKGVLDLSDNTPAIHDAEVIWRQTPKTTGAGHYGYRMAFDSDGYLFISSGDRQKLEPAQDMSGTLGKIVRLHDDGSVPEDNPFFDQGGVTAQIWSVGHRNPLGIAFDAQGQLWNVEMGPRHGDELNRVVKGANYGWPIVSEGNHYSGKRIPNHDTRPEFEAPRAAWVPTIAPGGVIFYTGSLFPKWQGTALIAGLKAEALIHVEVDGDSAKEITRYPMDKRIRAIQQGPEGNIWLLEDRSGGRLLKLSPSK